MFSHEDLACSPCLFFDEEGTGIRLNLDDLPDELLLGGFDERRCWSEGEGPIALVGNISSEISSDGSLLAVEIGCSISGAEPSIAFLLE